MKVISFSFLQELNDGIHEQDVYVSKALSKLGTTEQCTGMTASPLQRSSHIHFCSQWLKHLSCQAAQIELQGLSCRISFVSGKHLRKNSQINADIYYTNILIQPCKISVKNAIFAPQIMKKNLLKKKKKSYQALSCDTFLIFN